MELNALTRWESIGKDLYQGADGMGREIQRLKARSKHVEAQRSDAQAQRSQYEERIEGSAPGADTPPAVSRSHSQLPELEREAQMRAEQRAREERLIIAQFRALRDKGKRIRLEEEKLEQQTVAVPSRDVFPPGHQQWVYFGYRLLRRFFKGFAFGYAGKFAFAFVGLVLRHRLNLARLLPDLAALLVKKDLLSYGAFLGSFLTIFESAIRLLKMKSWLSRQKYVHHHRAVRVTVSASVAAAVAIQFLPQETRLGIAMFFSVRALEIMARWAVEREEKAYGTTRYVGEEGGKHVVLSLPPHKFTPSPSPLPAAVSSSADTVGVPSDIASAITRSTSVPPKDVAASNGQGGLVDTHSSMSLPPPSTLERVRLYLKRVVLRLARMPASDHFDTLVMAAASGQVIWAWLFNRSTVEPSYLRFLDHQGGRSREVQFGFVELHKAHHCLSNKQLDQINAVRSSEGRGHLDQSQPLTQLMCNVLHRDTESCTLDMLRFFKRAYLRALPVYLPVYALPMLLFKHRQLLHKPLQILVPTTLNLLRSSLFLSSYCTVCWGVACLATNLGVITSIKGVMAGFSGGLMVGIEKKGRRIELALYVLSQALPSTWRTLHQRGLVPLLPHGESLCFVASMAVILWAYVTRPHLMRSSYLSLFMFFFGSGGRAAGFSSRALEHSTPKSTGLVEDRAATRAEAHPGAAHRLHAAAALSPALTPSAPSESDPATVAASALLLPSPSSSASGVHAGSDSPTLFAADSALCSSPGALTMMARHSGRLSTVRDETETEGESGASASPSPTDRRTPVAST